MRKRWTIPGLLGGLLTLALGCQSDSDPAPRIPITYDPKPESPSIFRDVALIDDDAAFTHPYVPGHRTTMDGRVAIRVQGGPPGTKRITENLSFFLFVPERLEEPILGGPPGAEILGETTPFDVLFPPALDPAVEILGHHAICDPTGEFAIAAERPNPYVCGPDDANDCYDITVISSTSAGVVARLWGTPATIEVAEPKTSAARIIRAELGEPVPGVEILFNTEFTEPAVTTDGRLLTGRLGRVPRPWTHPDTGEIFIRSYDLAYSVLRPEDEPCDVTGWDRFHPMSHAPYDPGMIGTYGLAAYPFRDTEGNLIPDGEDMGGTYPWVDREGTNIFQSGVPGRLVEQSETKFPRRCVVPGCETFQENFDWDRGFMVAGLWTHGKLVHLDGMINNQDWAVGVTPASHYRVDLYRDDGQEVEVRFGSGRFIDRVRFEGGPYPPGYSHNANILDSLQNLPNHTAHAQPVTPRDVVWIMSTGVGTDEIVFDDYVDPDAFIVSNMQGSITQLYSAEGNSLATPRYWNGEVRNLLVPFSVAQLYVLEPELDGEVHVQNAATSLGWNVPAYGLVEAGTGRIEPVALGGVQGKGFWLVGDNAIHYGVPAQPRSIDEVDWYLGLYLDPRADDDLLRDVVRFPDGSGIRLAGRTRLQVRRDRRVVHEVVLPPTSGWMHLGWRLGNGNRDVTVLLDGLAIDRFTTDAPVFRMTEGDLVVGDVEGFGEGFRGWIDDFHVLAHDVNVEVACNHARGTLVRVVDDPAWATVADRHPDWAHEEVATAAGEAAGARYACYLDHTGDYAAHLANIPAGTVSLRHRINFPEGPLRAGVPRPDSTGNTFCLNCHHDEGQGGLTLEALAHRPVPAEHDERRQPLQPPRRVFGNVPPGWIPPGPGPGSPDEALRAPPEGFLIDRWVLAGP